MVRMCLKYMKKNKMNQFNITTAYRPYDNKKNDYVQITQQAIQRAGYQITRMDKSALLKILFHKKDAVKLINFNWYDEIIADSRLEGSLKTIQRKIIVMVLKLLGIKIVTTIHNRVPHEVKGYSNLKFRVWLLKKSDAVIQLSKDTEEVLMQQAGDYWSILKKKIFTIPLPSYLPSIHTYLPDMRHRKGWDENTFVILYTGLIKPYKN